MMLIKTHQTKEQRQKIAAVGHQRRRKIGVGIQQKQQRRQSRGPAWPAHDRGERPASRSWASPHRVTQLPINHRHQKNVGRVPRDVFGVHQRRRIGKKPVIEPMRERGDRTAKTQSQIRRRPPRQGAVILHHRQALWIPAETEKVTQDGRETAGIRRDCPSRAFVAAIGPVEAQPRVGANRRPPGRVVKAGNMTSIAPMARIAGR